MFTVEYKKFDESLDSYVAAVDSFDSEDSAVSFAKSLDYHSMVRDSEGSILWDSWDYAY